ncbi:MAG TPA: arginine N-succinyltransferase [Polyangiaceae bacterium]|nr:arginine N-succinyltransferase [Polyangiaceae bacterium]
MSVFEITAGLPADEDALLDLAAHLNTVNLPNDRAHIRSLLATSEQSFCAALPSAHRRYVFVLWDRTTGRAVATSSLIAKLGRRDAPYIYFDVIPEEKYSKLLDRHFQHKLLRLGFSYDGPTELGGLVVLPEYRRHPERLGRFISFIRFLYIAAHRNLFESEIIAELLPPLESDGTSHLWEALGRRFTGMTYAEADLLSSQNKDFIRDLFPSEAIYASVLSDAARDVIGKVGEQSKGVEKMLTEVGFHYAERVDPFDGGPHFIAQTDHITAVMQSKVLPFASIASQFTQNATVASFSTTAPFARAIRTPCQIDTNGLTLPAAAAHQLQVAAGAQLVCLRDPF